MSLAHARLCARRFLTVAGIAWLTSLSAIADNQTIPFDDERWRIIGGEVVTHLDRTCLRGAAVLRDVEFENGVIEVDMCVNGTRCFPGIVFRMQADGEYEQFYVRPHKVPMAFNTLQYAPVFNGATCWQLYHGNGFTAPAGVPRDRWFHVKMEIHGTQARVFLDDAAEPALVINELKHGASRGTIGVLGTVSEASHFADFSYRSDDDLEFAPAREPRRTPDALMDWQLSRAYPAAQVAYDTYPGFFAIFAAQWRPVTAEPSGLVNISRYAASSEGSPQRILARHVVRSESNQTVKLSFGYSDDATIFLNGPPVYTGRNGFRRRDPAFAGTIGYHDSVFLNLRKGLNEICLLVTDSFGGWGFQCRTDRELAAPIKNHERLSKVWETPADFKVPECVLYDAKRDVLYVTSFNRLQAATANQGFISRLALDGTVLDLEWVTGLDGPCGMGIHGDTLYVAAGSGHLIEIDADSGEVRARHAAPGANFLNDAVVAEDGTVYVTNSVQTPEDIDVFAFKDGQFEVWKTGDELCRCNGLLIAGDELLVGNTHGSLLKAVAFENRLPRDIVCFGAGVVDGIRHDGHGNYLVSRWEGQAYVVSPAGELVEILDTRAEGLNCADFEYIPEQRLLVVPTFLGNKVVAYRLSDE